MTNTLTENAVELVGTFGIMALAGAYLASVVAGFMTRLARTLIAIGAHSAVLVLLVLMAYMYGVRGLP